jgi:hypothetical protein
MRHIGGDASPEVPASPAELAKLLCDRTDASGRCVAAVSEAVFSPKGPWRMSFTNALHRAFTNARFKRLGLLPMEKLADA